MYIESHAVAEILRKIKKQGCVQDIARGKWLRNYALSHHDCHLSTVATFSRPNMLGDLLFADPFFYFCPVLVGSRQTPLLMCACLYKIVHMDHNPVKRWYAAQLSECRSVPSRRHLCIIGNRVAASPLDDLKVACCWTVFQQNYSKYPRVTGSPPFSVVLQDNNVQMLADARCRC